MAANGSPIGITTVNHQLTSGQQVIIAGANGNTNANGSWTVTVTGPNTFTLNGSVSNGTYSGGGTWSTTYVTDLQYIEQPDDFVVQPGVVRDPFTPTLQGATLPMLPVRRISTGGNLNTVVLEAPIQGTTYPYPDFSGSLGADQSAAGQLLWAVQPGDYLVVNDGLPQLITGLGRSAPQQRPTDIDTLTLASPLPNSFTTVANYRIIRAPRPTGDEQLQLPSEIVIDIGQNLANGQQPITAPFDILFAPSGEVLNTAAAPSMYYWVRDTAAASPTLGDPTIVVLYTRSGNVASFPVDPTAGGDPYSFAKTGRSSGL
jgi:hypothetical protein